MRLAFLLGLSLSCSFRPRAASDGGTPDSSSDGPGSSRTDADVPDAPPTCPSSYSAMGASHYRLGDTAKAWLDAELACEADGFGIHLAVAEMTSELADVDAVSSASLTWLGLTDQVTPTTWKWVNDAPNPPNLGNGGTRHCGRYWDGTNLGVPTGMGPTVQFESCASTLAYVCECDLIAADKNTY